MPEHIGNFHNLHICSGDIFESTMLPACSLHLSLFENTSIKETRTARNACVSESQTIHSMLAFGENDILVQTIKNVFALTTACSLL